MPRLIISSKSKNAREGSRTLTPLEGAGFWVQCVCQFRHSRMKNIKPNYQESISALLKHWAKNLCLRRMRWIFCSLLRFISAVRLPVPPLSHEKPINFKFSKKFGGPEESWTPYPLHAMQMLYQMSYRPIIPLKKPSSAAVVVWPRLASGFFERIIK